jgi:phosphatidylserine/phosphatidylglycerophosphate/cardiolipin synthase-like enzyme
MIKRSTRLIFIFYLFTVCIETASGQEFDAIELVESYPVETTLNMAEIRDTADVWKELIVGAQNSIDIETFYLSNKVGEPLEEILRELIKAGERGVQVRIISEATFFKTYPEPIHSLGLRKNIQVRIIDFGKIAGGVMHAKYFIVDNRSIFLGSQNWDWRSLKHIHEIGLLVKSRHIASVFGTLFNLDWQAAENPDSAALLFSNNHFSGGYLLSLVDRAVRATPVFSPAHFIPDETLSDESHLVALMDSAKQRICIQLLTYSPFDSHEGYYAVLDNAIRRAAARGVKVQLLCSDWCKRHPTIDYLKSLVPIPNVSVKLSTIPEASGGFIPFARVEHCKYLVTDETSFWLGTANWSRSYFHNGRNVGLVVKDALLTGTLQSFFDQSWNSPYAYPLDACENYTPPRISGQKER